MFNNIRNTNIYILINGYKNILKEHIKMILMSDKKYINFKFKKKFKKTVDFDNPRSFNEKLQWLKLNDRSELYTSLVDKFEVRKYVEKKIGSAVLNKCYGVYNSIDDINIEALPEKFVLKTTHDSGGVIICKNKSEINWKKEMLKFKIRLKNNYYYLSREYHYKNVMPRIICEALIEDKNNNLMDYKLFCFNGKVKFIQVDTERFTCHKRNFYNLEWELLDFEMNYEHSNIKIEKPNKLSKMIEYAEILSESMKFCRVDFYLVDESIIFGELTFFPEAGYCKFYPEEYDYIIGKYLHI